jgi:hypothetical protein
VKKGGYQATHKVMQTRQSRSDSRENFIVINYNFPGRTCGLGERGAHRQPQAGSTVLLQIQTGTFGEPPTPSASDLTLALDQY